MTQPRLDKPSLSSGRDRIAVREDAITLQARDGMKVRIRPGSEIGA